MKDIEWNKYFMNLEFFVRVEYFVKLFKFKMVFKWSCYEGEFVIGEGIEYKIYKNFFFSVSIILLVGKYRCIYVFGGFWDIFMVLG